MKKIVRILKITLFIVIGLSLFALTALYFIGRDLQKNKFAMLFPEDKDSIVIPFRYNETGVMLTQIVIENDTLDFVIDTGANNSIITPECLKGKATHKTFFNRLGQSMTDGSDIKGWKPKRTVKEFKWGDIVFKNHSFVVSEFFYSGIIGGDILRNFCVKFDNANNTIILSKENSTLLNNNDFKIPFTYIGNCPLIQGVFHSENIIKETKDSTSFKTFDLSFDTGFSGELKLNKPSYQSLSISPKKQKVWKSPNSSTLFAPEGIYSSDSTVVYSLYNFKVSDKTFANAIIYNSMLSESLNLIGTSFMRRFHSFTIDYPNKTICFQLLNESKNFEPKLKKQLPFYVEIPEKDKIDLSQDTIRDVPASSLQLLYTRFHSLGFDFKHTDNMLIVTAVELNNFKQGIHIGDTLIGVDSLLFDAKFLDLRNAQKQKFMVEKNIKNQIKLIDIAEQLKVNSRDYHFLKNGKLNTIKAKRDSTPIFRPNIAYSFGEEVYSFYTIFKSNYFNMNNADYNVHILPKPFAEKEIEVIEYRNKRKK